MINNKIINFAANLKFVVLKNKFTHKSCLKNKLCGDIIKIEVVLKKDTIKEMRYETNSCIFCEASASILSSKISAFRKKTIKKDFELLKEMAKTKNFLLPKKFKAFKDIINEKSLSRLDCIFLPFNALLRALKI